MSNTNPDRLLRRVAKVYVAGSSSEVDRAERLIDALRRAGVCVTSTWPELVRDRGANPRDATLSDRFRWSADDLAQVRDADLLVFLVPASETSDAATRGGWLEAGYAIGLGKEVLFAGDTKQSIFCALGYELVSDDEALRLVLEVGDQVAGELAHAHRDAEQWRLTAKHLASRLRSLRGVADDETDRVLAGAPIAEVSRG